MPRKTAMIVSGAITAFVLMVVLGLVYGSNQLAAAAGAATPQAPIAAQAQAAAGAQGSPAASDPGLQDKDAEIAQLQAEVQAYKQQLDQATTQLQDAYNQLQSLANTQNSQGGRRRFRDSEGGFEIGSEGSPLGQGSTLPFFGGDD